jgi:hypothetical protein
MKCYRNSDTVFFSPKRGLSMKINRGEKEKGRAREGKVPSQLGTKQQEAEMPTTMFCHLCS